MAANGSRECRDEFYSGFSILYITVPLTIIIVCKSILVIVAVIRTPSLYTNTNILVASMSVADILLVITFLFFDLTKLGNFKFDFREEMIFSQVVFGEWYSSLLLCLTHNGIIAIDRYILISHPFYYMKHVTKKCIFIVLLCVWICALILLFLPLMVYRGGIYQNCIMMHSPLEFFCIGVSVYLASCITILVCYFRIAILAFKHKMAANARRLHNSANNVDSVFTTNLTAALKSAKFFALMFGVFLFCTLPPVICGGINVNDRLPTSLYVPIMLLMPVNSILSFIVYFGMNKTFYQAVKRTISVLAACVCKRNSSLT